MIKKSISFALAILATTIAYANTDSLRNEITKYCNNYRATVGVAMTIVEDSDTMSINGDKMFPMLSVYKLPIAMSVLNSIDNGSQTLQTAIHVSQKDMHPDTWSPLRDKLTTTDTFINLRDIIQYTLIQSDNNCSDLLLKSIGGVEAVQTYLKELGLPNIQINNSEWEMFQSWNLIYSNQARPRDITTLLTKLYSETLFSDSCHSFLWHTLTDCTTGNSRIKGKLPAGTEVAHKTGTSFTTAEGITPAINDVGIITLPNGKHIAISIFVAESKESKAVNENIIAEITKMIWDYGINIE